MLNLQIIATYSEMHEAERDFLFAALKKHRPKKIVEIGIAAGANSALILDFLEEQGWLNSAQLHSIDYNYIYYRDFDKPQPRKSGFLVNELVPHLAEFWHFHADGFAANHLDKVGKGIDFCIIDTVHTAPGEALDFLMVLPYLTRDAVVVFHDLTYHIFRGNSRDNVCALVFAALQGRKILPKPYEMLGFKELDKNSSMSWHKFKMSNDSNFLSQNIGLCELSHDTDFVFTCGGGDTQRNANKFGSMLDF